MKNRKKIYPRIQNERMSLLTHTFKLDKSIIAEFVAHSVEISKVVKSSKEGLLKLSSTLNIDEKFIEFLLIKRELSGKNKKNSASSN